MLHNARIATRLALGIALMLIAVMSFILPAALGQLNAVNANAERRQLDDLQRTMQAKVNGDAAQALLVVTSTINAPGVTDAFAKRDRAKLQALTLPTFEALKKTYNIRQFQFHTSPATSFLRLHDLAKYGDDLSGFRATVVKANRELRTQSGLESGVAGLGLRGVVPVYNGGVHIGSAEIGLSFGQDFFTDFTSSYNAPAALHLPGEGGTFTTFATTIPGKAAADGKNLSAVLNSAELLSVMRGETVSKTVQAGGKTWSLLAKAIKDFSGEPLGVVEIMTDRSQYAATYRSTLIRILLIGLASLLAGLGLAALVSRTITRPIAQLTGAAEAISRGQFSEQIVGTDRKDEIGSLARAIERMAVSIKVAIERFKK